MKDCLPQKADLYQEAFPTAIVASANKAVLLSMEDAMKKAKRSKYGKYSSKASKSLYICVM